MSCPVNPEQDLQRTWECYGPLLLGLTHRYAAIHILLHSIGAVQLLEQLPHQHRIQSPPSQQQSALHSRHSMLNSLLTLRLTAERSAALAHISACGRMSSKPQSRRAVQSVGIKVQEEAVQEETTRPLTISFASLTTPTEALAEG